MFDFISEARQCFAGVVRKFGLKFIPVDDTEFLLAGSDFAVSIAYDRDGLDVNYIDKTRSGPQSYRLTNFLSSQKFTSEDRLLYGQPITGVDRIMASMRVFASGLENRCPDILNGGKAWLANLKKRDPDLWSGMPTQPNVAAVLATI